MPIPKNIKQELKNKTANYTHLDLQSRNISDDDIPELCSLLKNNPQITSIDVTRTNLTKKSAELLATLPLEELTFSNTYLHDAGASFLLKNPTIRYLDMRKCGLSNAIEDDILNNNTITYLEVSQNKNISAELLQKIKKHVAKNKFNADATHNNGQPLSFLFKAKENTHNTRDSKDTNKIISPVSQTESELNKKNKL